jgi:hypothetical protein
MTSQHDLVAIGRAVIDANLYMTLGTVGEDGQPWVSPVFYAADGYAAFYWTSSLEARHSRNLARRPRLSIVVFDSRVPAFTGQAVYMSATAAELDGADLRRGVEVFPGPAERGGRAVTPEELRPPSPYRLFRATASRQWILCPDPSGGTSEPCALHGRAVDHRTAVTL